MSKLRSILGTMVGVVVVCAFVFAAAQTKTKGIAVLVKAKGNVMMTKAGAQDWVAAGQGQVLLSGVVLKTGEDGLAMVKFLDDKSLVRMKPKTVLVVNAKKAKDGSDKEFKVDVGTVLFHIKKKVTQARFEVKTPTSVATVKGTKFWVVVKENGTTHVITLEDLVGLLNLPSKNEKDVGAGYTGISDSVDVVVRKTKPSDLPEGEAGKTLEVLFKDDQGATKKLRVEIDELE